jgi:hypothetical protein
MNNFMCRKPNSTKPTHKQATDTNTDKHTQAKMKTHNHTIDDTFEQTDSQTETQTRTNKHTSNIYVVTKSTKREATHQPTQNHTCHLGPPGP